MFISWKSFSWLTIIGVVFFWFFFTLESPLIFWFFLEVGVWGTFFFFLVGEEEEKSKTSIRFFIIQGLSSLFWITLLSLKNGLREIIIPLIIFIKIGLIPGHFWAWKIYERGNPYLILIISFFQKILPLGMIFFCLRGGDLTCSSLKILIVLNIISSCYFLKKEINLNLFLLISRMVHFNNIIFLLINEKVLETVFYFFSYSLLLFFALLFSLRYHKSLISLDRGGPRRGESAWMLGALSIAGFPPSLIFFIKIIMLVNLGNVIQSFFFLFFAVLLFFYLLIMVSSFVQFVHLSRTLYGGVGFSLEERKKNFANPSIFFLFSFSFIIFLLVRFSLLVLEKKKILLTPLGLSYY